MNFEAPSQSRLEKEHREQRSQVIQFRDRVMEITGDNQDEDYIRTTIYQVLTEGGIHERASRVYYTNQIMAAVKNKLRSIAKKLREGKLNPAPRDNPEPLFHHPELGPNQ